MHQQNRIRLGYDAPKARGSILMKTHYTVVLAALTGVGIGGLAVQGIHAQAKPPAYYIAEIDVTTLPRALEGETGKAVRDLLGAVQSSLRNHKGTAVVEDVSRYFWTCLCQ